MEGVFAQDGDGLDGEAAPLSESDIWLAVHHSPGRPYTASTGIIDLETMG